MRDRTIIEDGAHLGDELHYRHRVEALAGAPRYESLLAKGAYGVAVRVRTEGGRGPMRVVKLLRHEHLSEPGTVRRFRRELAAHARVSRSLQVPRVVPCLAYREAEDVAHAHAVYPWYEDGSLACFLDAGGTVAQALQILVDAGEALQGLHGHGYVHRDICPSNIFVAREGGLPRGLLGDLGVGLFLEANTLISTEEISSELHLRVGHDGFIDPRQGGTALGDVYALGATLYWVICGAPPPSPGADGIPAPPRDRWRDGVDTELGEALVRILPALTAPDPHRRVAGAAAAAELLRGCLPHGPLFTPAPQTRARRPSRRWAVWGAGAAFLVSATATGVAVIGPYFRAPASEPARAGAAATRGEPQAPDESLRRLLSLAAPGEHDDVAGLEERLRERLRREADRGELRLALARALMSTDRAEEASRILREAPAEGTYRPEIRELLAFLDSRTSSR